jgi:hypothetical protein
MTPLDAVPGDKIIVTLLHGTFAPNTAWVQEASSFCAGLRKHLGGSVGFYRIGWGGANTTAARQRGGEKLAAHILQVFHERPGTPHFIVGHSHAGNMALYALRDPEVGRKISGIVALNTPFVCVLRRNTFQLFALMGALTVTWMLALSVMYPIVWLGRTGFGEWSGTLPWWQLVLLSLVYYVAIMGIAHLGGAAGMRMSRAVNRVAKWTVARREALIQDMSLPRTTVPLLAMRCAGDEVVSFVGITSVIANAPIAVLHPWSLFAAFCLLFTAHWAGWMPSLVSWLGSVRGSYVDTYVNRFGAAVMMPALEYTFSSGIYLTAMVCVVLTLTAVLVPFLRMAPIGLGWRHLFDSLFVNLSFTFAPVTSERTEFVDIDPLGTGLLTLGHFKIHDHPDAFRIIAEWMKDKAGEQRRESQV